MSSDIPGLDDIIDDTVDPNAADQPTAADDPVGAQKRRGLVVPGNIMPWIEDASDQFGVPRDLLAAVVYQHSRFIGLNPSLVHQVSRRLAESFVQIAATGRSDYPGEEEQNEPELWLDAAARFAYGTAWTGSARAYRAQIGKVYGPDALVPDTRRGREGKLALAKPSGITLGTDVRLPTGRYQQARFPGGIGGGALGGVGKQPIIPGLSDDDATAVQRIADPLYIKYFGHFPSVAEYIDFSKRRLTPRTLEDELRARPFGGTTVGKYNDMQAIADRYAQTRHGRDADPGEINYLLSKNITAPDDIDAFYEQLKMRHDTGDPAFAWVADPQTWRDTEREVAQAWHAAGLTGKVDPHLVNRALEGKWTADDLRREIDGTPAPGYPPGTTVGQVNATRRVAQAWQDQYDPTTPLSNADVQRFLGMSPDQVREHYYSLPARASGIKSTPEQQPAPPPVESAPGIPALPGGSVEQAAKREQPATATTPPREVAA